MYNGVKATAGRPWFFANRLAQLLGKRKTVDLPKADAIVTGLLGVIWNGQWFLLRRMMRMFNGKPIFRRLLLIALWATTTLMLRGAAGNLWADNVPLTPLQPAAQIVPAITKPSDTRNLAFMAPGIVREMLVKPGDVVEKGQVLAREDADLEEAQLKSMEIEANSTEEIQAAEKERDAKKVHYEALKEAGGGTNPKELREAELDYQVAELKILVAQDQHAQKQAEADRQKKKIEKMTLYSPVKGIVEKVSVQPGEAVDPSKPDGAISLVVNTPLWAEMHLPTRQADSLKVGDTLNVSYADDSAAKTLPAKIIYKAPVADAASGTQTVRLELPNEQGKETGLLVNVSIPAVVNH